MNSYEFVKCTFHMDLNKLCMSDYIKTLKYNINSKFKIQTL